MTSRGVDLYNLNGRKYGNESFASLKFLFHSFRMRTVSFVTLLVLSEFDMPSRQIMTVVGFKVPMSMQYPAKMGIL